MVNIEIHRGKSREGERASLMIMEGAIMGVGMGGKVAIAKVDYATPRYCGDCAPEAPFLRILGENKEEIEKVVEIIKRVGLTKYFYLKTIIENSFIPKEE